MFDLSRTGPVVIEFPAGRFACGALDWWERPIFQLGPNGLDKGKGGKYLVVGPWDDLKKYQGRGMLALRSPTNKIFLGARVLAQNPAALEEFKRALKVYPLSGQSRPARFIAGLDKPWAATPPRGPGLLQSAAPGDTGRTSGRARQALHSLPEVPRHPRRQPLPPRPVAWQGCWPRGLRSAS